MIHRVCLFLVHFSKALRLFDHTDFSEFVANNFEHSGEDQPYLIEDITFQKQILNTEKESSPSSTSALLK